MNFHLDDGEDGSIPDSNVTTSSSTMATYTSIFVVFELAKFEHKTWLSNAVVDIHRV